VARILIIDDDDQVRALLRQILSRDAHEVIEASNGKQGAQVFHEQPVDLVITDLVMPEREGIETIVELRRTHSDIQVIAMSGGGAGDAETYLQGARLLGARRVLRKPFGRQDLLEAVREVIGKPTG
jgi:DNA-binding response OmpR family regulator